MHSAAHRRYNVSGGGTSTLADSGRDRSVGDRSITFDWLVGDLSGRSKRSCEYASPATTIILFAIVAIYYLIIVNAIVYYVGIDERI